MLTTVGTAPCTHGQLVVDEYIPLSFRAYDGVLPGPFLWRTGDMNRALLEMKIDVDSCVVCSVTLLAFSGTVVHDGLNDKCAVPAIQGLPVVDVSGFPKLDYPRNRLDETRLFHLVVRNDAIRVVFDDELPPERCIWCDRLRFFVAATGAIIAVEFDKLTMGERKLIAARIEGLETAR